MPNHLCHCDHQCETQTDAVTGPDVRSGGGRANKRATPLALCRPRIDDGIHQDQDSGWRVGGRREEESWRQTECCCASRRGKADCGGGYCKLSLEAESGSGALVLLSLARVTRDGEATS